jgi:hypothetical protein
MKSETARIVIGIREQAIFTTEVVRFADRTEVVNKIRVKMVFRILLLLEVNS